MPSLYPVTQPIKPLFGLDGLPLNGGYVYFGTANQNPETTPVVMYWDVAGTIPVAQPVRTVNGFLSRQGTPSNIYATGDFSITVRDSALALVCTSPVSVDTQLAQAVIGSAGSILLADAGSYFTTDNVEAAFQQLGPLIAQMVTALAGGVPTGCVMDYAGDVDTGGDQRAPAGWLLVSEKTIGSASSGATTPTNVAGIGGAHASTSTLYTMLWNSYTNTELVIQDSAGTPTTRGASAAADFAANKRLPVPDSRGRVRATKDSQGGATASRLTNAGSGIVGTTRGVAGGSQSHTLITAELPVHTHAPTDPTHTHTFTGSGHTHSYTIPDAPGGAYAGSGGFTAVPTRSGSTTGSTVAGGTNAAVATGITIANAGSGTAHFNVQPTIIFSTIIKL